MIPLVGVLIIQPPHARTLIAELPYPTVASPDRTPLVESNPDLSTVSILYSHPSGGRHYKGLNQFRCQRGERRRHTPCEDPERAGELQLIKVAISSKNFPNK